MRFEEIIKESPTLTRNFQRDISGLGQKFAQLHRIFIKSRDAIELDSRYDVVMGNLDKDFSHLEDLEQQNLKLDKG